MTEEMLDEKQLLQEGEYEYPYHYIPTWGSGGFSQTRFWSWGFRYNRALRWYFNVGRR